MLKYLNIVVLIIYVILIIVIIVPAQIFSQTIESARQKFLSGDYEGAEKEIKIILENEMENIEAENLLLQIEKVKKKQKSQLLTEKAILEIGNRNFEEAYRLLREAIIQDPENERAKKLFLSINEVMDIEQKSVGEIVKEGIEKSPVVKELQIARTTGTITKSQDELEIQGKVSQTGDSTSLPVNLNDEKPKKPESKPEKIKPAEKVEQPSRIEPGKPQERIIPPEQPEVKTRSEKRKDFAIIEVASIYTMANSNNLDYVNSRLSLMGGDISGYYYFKFLEGRFGVSMDYSISFLKLKGEDVVNFLVQKLNASLRYRIKLFKTPNGKELKIGTELGYNMFFLKNRTAYGVYKFTTLYSPCIGLFASDPVLHRFIKKRVFEDLGFEGKLSFVYLFNKEAPYSVDIYSGVFYDLGRYRIIAGLSSLINKDKQTREIYNNFHFGTGYRF